jgi:hypothetical protein
VENVLDNHVGELVSMDFFTVPTATFRVLFVLIILAHDRRKIVHFNVTEHPTAEWTGQQIVEAFCEDKVPRFLIRAGMECMGWRFRSGWTHSVSRKWSLRRAVRGTIRTPRE